MGLFSYLKKLFTPSCSHLWSTEDGEYTLTNVRFCYKCHTRQYKVPGPDLTFTWVNGNPQPKPIAVPKGSPKPHNRLE